MSWRHQTARDLWWTTTSFYTTADFALVTECPAVEVSTTDGAEQNLDTTSSQSLLCNAAPWSSRIPIYMYKPAQSNEINERRQTAERQIGMRLVRFWRDLTLTIDPQPPCKSSDNVSLDHPQNWFLRNW